MDNTNKKSKRGLRILFPQGGSPSYIAKGFALGSFIGMMPIPGFQVFVSIFLASLLKVNKTAASLAVFNTNIFTGVFIFAFNFWLGKTVLGFKTNFEFPEQLSFDFIMIIFNAGA